MPKAKAKTLALAHASLLKDIRKLEDSVRSTQQEGSAIGRLLQELKKHILEHFQFEEKDGYMDLVRRTLPNKEGMILKLLEEHRHLEQSLDGLINEAHKPLDDDFRDIVLKWIDRIRHHESQENAFIQEAVNLEIGGQD
jgi:hemerythrin